MTAAAGHSFIYDGNGKRVKDLKNYIPRYSIYNQADQMLYQWDQRSETITDYIFLGGKLVTESQVSLGDGSQSVDNTNVGYTGHQWDQDTGLNYMQARYYDPLLGRFYSNDPVGFSNIYNFNRYTYANNNPYKYLDPTGMASDCSENCYYQKGGPGRRSNPGSESGDGAVVIAGAVIGGAVGIVVAGACDAASGGICAAGNPAIVGGAIALGSVFGKVAEEAINRAKVSLNKLVAEKLKLINYAASNFSLPPGNKIFK